MLLVEIFKWYQLLNKTFILANRVDPSGMLPSAAAHNGLPCFLFSCLWKLLNKTFILANRVDSPGMLHSAAAHNGLPCFLLSYLLDAMH